MPVRWIGPGVCSTCISHSPSSVHCSSPTCSSQGDKRGGSGHCHSLVMAQKRVVSPGVAAPMQRASVAARATRQSHYWSRWLGSPQPLRTPPSRFKTLERDLTIGEAFWERLQLPFAQLIGRQHAICTAPSGGHFVTGILNRKRIPFIVHTSISEQCWAISSICSGGTLNTPLFLVTSQPLALVWAR